MTQPFSRMCEAAIASVRLASASDCGTPTKSAPITFPALFLIGSYAVMYGVPTTAATPRYPLPELIAAATAFGFPSAPVAGMYVPIARAPVVAFTVVATRSRSPAVFIRWKNVTAPPTRSAVSSTNGVAFFAFVFCPSQSPSTVTRGSVTCFFVWSTWFVAVHVAVCFASVMPPCWASSPSAACMPRSTSRCTSSPTEETRVLTSDVARSSSDSFDSVTALPVLSANRPLCQAPTSTSTSAVTRTLPRPRIISL